MANKSPHKARTAKQKKRVHQAGNMDDLRSTLWGAIAEASTIVSDTSAKPELRLRATHAITQASSAYVKLLEASEFEARLRALEEQMDGDGAGL